MKKLRLFFTLAILLTAFFNANSQSTINDPFFDRVDYIGAFGTSDWTSGWANFNPQNTIYPTPSVTIPAGDITTNTTWSAGISPVLNAASFSNSVLSDPFFDQVSYIGAFGTDNWTAGWANFDPQNTSYPTPTVTIPAGTITTNTA